MDAILEAPVLMHAVTRAGYRHGGQSQEIPHTSLNEKATLPLPWGNIANQLISRKNRLVIHVT